MKSLLSSLEMKKLWDNYQAEMPTVGMQVHHNHDKCDAGTDTKKRLYLKRTTEGMAAFCHHCGRGGFLRTSREPRRLEMLLEEKTVEASRPKTNPFVGKLLPFDMWPTEPKLWWMSHEMDAVDAAKYRVTWHDDSNRLVLSSPALLQGRAFYGGSPKYITYQFLDTLSVFCSKLFGNVVFVVEDLTSAYKLHKAGANVLALTGTKFTERHLAYCCAYKTVVLWLDGDVAGALGGISMFRQLQGLVDVYVIHGPPAKEPKETPLHELKEVVKSYARY